MQGAALHPVAFEKATPKLYYGLVEAWVDSFDVLSVPGVYRRGMAGAASVLFSQA